MFCSHCGKECSDNVKFCVSCGKPLYDDKELEAKKPETPKKPQKPKDMAKMKKTFKKAAIWSFVSFALSLILAISSAAYYFISPMAAYGDKPATPPKSEEVSDPTYDTDKMKKSAMKQEDFGEEGSAEEVASLNSDLQSVKDAIKATEGELSAEHKNVTMDNRDEYVSAVMTKMSELRDNGAISDYYSNDGSVTVELNSGIKYVYMPEIDGVDAGGAGTLQIETLQPCLSGYSSNVSKFMEYPDKAAEKIESTFSQYNFDDKGNLDNGEVDIASLYGTTGYNVVLWHGHGGYDDSLGSFMVTGILADDVAFSKYYQLLIDNSFLITGSGIAVTPIFFEEHIDDGAYDNTVVYLGACSSGRSDRLANAFLDKGAEAVYANSGVIHTKYNLSMMKAVSEALCTVNDSGRYNNVEEALRKAKEKEGSRDNGDCSSTEVRLYTNDNTYTLGWYEETVKAEREVVLVLDASGSMSGTPMTETKKAAVKFVDTVLDAKATISVVAYGSSAETLIGFSYNKNALKSSVNSIGGYGGTNMESGLNLAEDLLSGSKAKKKIIILMSDGMPNDGLVGDDLVDYADKIRNKGVNIYSLGFFHSISGSTKAAAQKLMQDIADPGCYHDVVSADEIEYVFDDIASEISGERRMYIRVACPVDVEITFKGETLSKENPRTSFGSISFEEEQDEEKSENSGNYGMDYSLTTEEESAYGYGFNNGGNSSGNNKEKSETDNTIKTIRLKEQEGYEMKIVGTGDGTMDYTIGFMDKSGEYTDLRDFKDITITENTEIETKPMYSDTTTLTVDEDGDGDIDYIYTAEKGKKSDKKDMSGLSWKIILAIVFGGICAAAFLLFLLFKKMGKKYKEIEA